MDSHTSNRLVSRLGGISGVASALGSWQVCHTVCLGIVTLLAGIGITLTGMPLSFLTTIAKPVWSIAVVHFFIMMYLSRKHHCVSNKLILLNAGFLIIGIPFIQKVSLMYYSIGGTLISIALFLYAQTLFKKVKRKHLPFITVGVLLVIVIIFFSVLVARSSSVVSTPSSATTKTYESITTGTTGSGDVEITLTPSYSKGKLVVSMVVNTHSVDLSIYNLARISALSVNGATILPTSAPTLTGHHNQGTIIYSLKTVPNSFTITMNGIPKVSTRTYSWGS